MKVNDAIGGFLNDVRLGKSKATWKAYGNSIKWFKKYLSILDVNAVEELTVQCFCDFPFWLVERSDLKIASKTLYVTASVEFFNWLTFKGLIEPSSQDYLKLKKSRQFVLKERESKLPRTPYPGDVEKMVETVYQMNNPEPARSRDIALVEFLVCTGCRVGEVSRLIIRDVNFDNNTAIVTGKGSKERVVLFTDTTARALADYWKERGDRGLDSPVFSRHDKRIGLGGIAKLSTRTIENIITSIAKAADLWGSGFTPHQFRHGFAVKFLRETGNLAMLQDLMGHSTADSTRVYAKIALDDVKKSYDEVFAK